ncbi:hypothetical protein T310_2806 [Rasamsonia emersonii CBS 393.64]|uniref:Uncharacterized protein n=1 Tax=Rasamsonia emersonii (strain ATCC 16479 / CBS 393.64 / IMI 116815) TaxID=1408163 RepID=A0A0F4YY74_RASE3|nr:hypothetical protein T310_2806 [Rasamsonia emersonii CBS 393.64]KKA23174.1 hypothetical protein T310_2806 [Rasamsonia emersonii CBS 393.64]
MRRRRHVCEVAVLLWLGIFQGLASARAAFVNNTVLHAKATLTRSNGTRSAVNPFAGSVRPLNPATATPETSQQAVTSPSSGKSMVHKNIAAGCKYAHNVQGPSQQAAQGSPTPGAAVPIEIIPAGPNAGLIPVIVVTPGAGGAQGATTIVDGSETIIVGPGSSQQSTATGGGKASSIVTPAALASNSVVTPAAATAASVVTPASSAASSAPAAAAAVGRTSSIATPARSAANSTPAAAASADTCQCSCQCPSAAFNQPVANSAVAASSAKAAQSSSSSQSTSSPSGTSKTAAAQATTASTVTSNSSSTTTTANASAQTAPSSASASSGTSVQASTTSSSSSSSTSASESTTTSAPQTDPVNINTIAFHSALTIKFGG